MYIVCVKIFWQVGFEAVNAIYMMRILKNGFPKEYYVVISAILIPISVAISHILGMKSGPGKELSLFYSGLYW